MERFQAPGNAKLGFGGPRNPSPTVLIVDDNTADQFLVLEAMRVAGPQYDVRLVSDGDEALEYLYHRGRYRSPTQAPRPGLILLDLNMPRFSGRQVAQAIKSDPGLKDIPVVVVTASNRDEDVQELYSIGANSYLEKPANFDDFTAALRDLSAYWLGRATLPKPVGL